MGHGKNNIEMGQPRTPPLPLDEIINGLNNLFIIFGPSRLIDFIILNNGSGFVSLQKC